MKVLTVGQAWFLVLPDVSSLTKNTNVAILLVIQSNMKTGYNGILKKKLIFAWFGTNLSAAKSLVPLQGKECLRGVFKHLCFFRGFA